MTDTPAQNDQLVLVSGKSGTGKSTSLMKLENQDKWFYVNAEGKRLPFRSKFKQLRLEDPYQIYEALDVGKDDDNCIGLALDTVTFLLDMYESQYIRTAVNTQKAWGDFANFFKVLMLEKIVEFDKPVVIFGHTLTTHNEELGIMETNVPVKGSLKNNGIESYFSTVVSTKKVTIKDLSKYQSDLLNITEEEEMLGFKHVFQTRLTKETKDERIRSPIGMFSTNETYMDNDINLLMKRLNEYYN